MRQQKTVKFTRIEVITLNFISTCYFFCRMVVAGYNMIRGIFADSASVFRYDQAYGLNQEQVHFNNPSSEFSHRVGQTRNVCLKKRKMTLCLKLFQGR